MFPDPMGGLDMQALIDSFPHYVMIIDEDHRIWMVNHAVRGALDVNPEEIIGKDCPRVVHDSEGPYPGCPLEEALRTGEDVEKELVDDKDGSRYLSCVYPTGFTTADGKKLFLHTTRSIPSKETMS